MRYGYILRLALCAALMTLSLSAVSAEQSTREERKAIEAGNKAYRNKDYAQALEYYSLAIDANPNSLVALFNQALATVQTGNALPGEQQNKKDEMMTKATDAFANVAKHGADNPSLASRASYNMGNIAFNKKDYQGAIDSYKQALRLNPSDADARRNLRIAQLRQEKNKDNKNENNKDKNKDKKQQQNKQDQDKKENKDNNKDQNNNNQNNKPKPKPQKPEGISQQAADRILKRSADKEKETRKRSVYGRQQGQGNDPFSAPKRGKRW